MAFPGGWNRKVKLTIDNTKVSVNLTDFPVLITKDNLPDEVLDADGSFPALSDGGDIRITTDEAGTTEISVEIQEFTIDNDPANGVAFIWTKVPSVSSSVDTDIWVWYNNSGANIPGRTDTFGSENVWDSNFVGVWHLHEGTSTDADFYKDATSHANHGQLTDANANSVQTDGQIGKALDFNGDADYITTVGLSIAEGSSNTSSVWVNLDNVTDTDRKMFMETGTDFAISSGWRNDSSENEFQIFTHYTDGHNESVGSLLTIVASTWYYVVGRVDVPSGEMTVWVNGVKDATDNTGFEGHTIKAAVDLNIGTYRDADGRFMQGILDEVRVSSKVREDAWILTEYNNQNSPSTFITEGTPEDAAVVFIPYTIHKKIRRNVLLRM